VLGEESDERPEGGYCSHFELYREAMIEVGASTTAIDTFITLQRRGLEARAALQQIDVPPGVSRFVESTLLIALNAPTHSVAAAFLHGRESVIPAMFERLLQGSEVINRQAPVLVHYMNRHIELDTQGHEPGAQQLLQHLIGNDVNHKEQAIEAALDAVENRIAFWDTVRASLQLVHS
jgi:hypothetical protein